MSEENRVVKEGAEEELPKVNPEEESEEEKTEPEVRKAQSTEHKGKKSIASQISAKVAVIAVVALFVGILIGQFALPVNPTGLVSLPGEGGEETVDMDALKAKVEAYLNENILGPQGVEGKILSIEPYNDEFYTMKVNILRDGESLAVDNIFLSKSGNALSGTVTFLDEEVEPIQIDTTPQPTPTPQESVLIQDFMDDDPTKGSDSAPIVIIEFSDFECPFCGKFYSQTLAQIEKDYIDTGIVQMVYRDFPLGFHPQAKPAAMAGECADDQGKFWEMHDKIFENQAALSETSLKQWAQEIGLNTTTFDDCFDSAKYSSEIDADMADGTAAGIDGTPGFLIGTRDGTSQIISGAQPYSTFKAVIDSLLE